MSNTELWKKAFKTDPKHVKEITGKQYRGNSPKPYHLIDRANQIFGDCGEMWGIRVINERFERLTETDVLHVALVEFWYLKDGGDCVIQQMGQTKAAYMSSKGIMVVDEDAPKKSVTDAMVKCMSMLGFAGDIFSGRWDDSKYIQEVNAEYREAEKKIEFINQEQFDTLGELIIETKTEAVRFCQAMGCKSLAELPSEKYAHAKMLLEKKRDVNKLEANK